jgi:hypothetical protein
MGWLNGKAVAVIPPEEERAKGSAESLPSPLALQQTANHQNQNTTTEVAKVMPVMDIEQAIARRDQIVDYTRRGMVEGVDYGKIPGAGDRMVLLQPGADKLCNLFGLVIRYESAKEEDWSGEKHGGEPFFKYNVRAIGYRGDYVVGEGVGSCNSWEAKYRWRKKERSCPVCGKENIRKSRDGGWYCWVKTDGCGTTFEAGEPSIESQQVGRKPNPDIFDQVNTLEKMAYKRAKVSCTINCLSASEFTQDMEDFTPPAEDIDIGSNPPNSRAAQQYVAEQKIRSGNPQPIRVVWKNMAEMAAAFKAMREAVGEVAWREELERYGWADFTGIRNSLDAKRDPQVREKVSDLYRHLEARKGGK